MDKKQLVIAASKRGEKVQYSPITGVWEITMGCNMRCKHCGSACENALEGELSTEEALDLCDQIVDLGFDWITLSGGEPTTRKDLDQLINRLNKGGVIPNIITNGWNLNEELLDKIIDAGVGTIGISIDGLQKTHDYIRREGSYQRIINALKLMKKKNAYSGVITTINKMNISELPELKEVLIENGVCSWQLQIALPMGSFFSRKDMVIDPEQANYIIDFAYDVYKENKIDVNLADCLGYYNLKEVEIRKKALNTEDSELKSSGLWSGCTAGKYSLGILHNGDINGCTSIRSKEFIEGNIRERSLRDIWEDENSFKWNREIKKEDLSGFCSKCKYGDRCLGGCANTRLVLEGSIYSENRYCVYNIAMKKAEEMINKENDYEQLKSKGRLLVEKDENQLAELLLSRALSQKEDDIDLLCLYGYVNFMLKNYKQAIWANQKALDMDSDNAYANKGMGLTLYRMGKEKEGIEFLRKAVSLSDKNFMDPYYDLAVVYTEINRREEARNLLERGRKISPSFIKKSQELYDLLSEENLKNLVN